MGLFSKRSNKKEQAYASSGPATTPNPVPNLDVDKAAEIIEARARGKLARSKTSNLKAHRAMPNGEENGFFAALGKCFPCVQSK